MNEERTMLIPAKRSAAMSRAVQESAAAEEAEKIAQQQDLDNAYQRFQDIAIEAAKNRSYSIVLADIKLDLNRLQNDGFSFKNLYRRVKSIPSFEERIVELESEQQEICNRLLKSNPKIRESDWNLRWASDPFDYILQGVQFSELLEGLGKEVKTKASKIDTLLCGMKEYACFTTEWLEDHSAALKIYVDLGTNIQGLKDKIISIKYIESCIPDGHEDATRISWSGDAPCSYSRCGFSAEKLRAISRSYERTLTCINSIIIGSANDGRMDCQIHFILNDHGWFIAEEDVDPNCIDESDEPGDLMTCDLDFLSRELMQSGYEIAIFHQNILEKTKAMHPVSLTKIIDWSLGPADFIMRVRWQPATQNENK